MNQRQGMTADPGHIDRGRRFLALHQGGLFILANAWDAASARIFEAAGCVAVGTSSAGVAFSLGCPDGERVCRKEMLAAVARIARAVEVPVSADMESGYGDTPEAVVETVQAVIQTGAVGVNLEDAAFEGRLFDLRLQVEKIRAARCAADASGVPFVVNARTDIFWHKLGQPRERLPLAIARANAYREAGADCLFVPGVVELETIRTLAREITGPLNVLASPGCPPIAALAEAGVRRVSLGSGPMRATMGLARRIGEELLAQGTYHALHQGAISYREANTLFNRRKR
jgi:2-methylisocitrate lyase-like PEP mutase family enzyme